MIEFDLNGNITDENFVIHDFNNLPKESDAILDGIYPYHFKQG